MSGDWGEKILKNKKGGLFLMGGNFRLRRYMNIPYLVC